ncbi:hypothetical protein EAE99_010984 [Botrytis elliptica]|nr:hypothetical protein EAE99_010984 [Botrytis elliptica]
MENRKVSKMAAARWPKHCAQEDLIASAQPRHITPLERNSCLGKRGHYIRYLLLVVLILAFAVVSKNFWGAYFARGGPGGSGVNLARNQARHLQTIVDSPSNPNDTSNTKATNKYFDIVSFDPRGTGFTTPAFICFPDAAQRMNWNVASDVEGMLGSSSVAFKLMWARKHALADACYTRMGVGENGEDALGAYMNTPVVAMDMKAIVEALSRSRDESLIRGREYTKSSKIESVDKIQYWGFSYETLLGTKFAAMYPGFVGRMVLDGVVDADRHYAGTWGGNLEDAETIINKFSEYCFEACPERCALYSSRGSEHIHDLLDDIITSVTNAPIPVSVSDARGPEIITSSDVKGAVRLALFSPFEEFERLARILYDVSQRNGTLLANSKSMEYAWQDLQPRCRSSDPYSSYCFSPLSTMPRRLLEPSRALMGRTKLI